MDILILIFLYVACFALAGELLKDCTPLNSRPIVIIGAVLGPITLFLLFLLILLAGIIDMFKQ